MTEISPLQLALELEQKGYEYYTANAAKAANPLAQRVLESLAEQEKQHMSWIRSLVEGSQVPCVSTKAGSIEAAVREVFDKFSAAERQGWKNRNTDVYEHAMQLEKESYELYRKLHEAAVTAAEKDFFAALMEMEDGHHAALQNVHFYLSDTADWNHESESASGWNWMTL